MKMSTFTRSKRIIYTIIFFSFCLIYSIYFYSLKKDSLNVLEYDISLKMSEVYSEICPSLIEAIETSKKMAADGFLIPYLSASDTYEMDSFKKAILRQLASYYKYNKYDGVFLVIAKNLDFYTQDGFISTINTDNESYYYYNDFIYQNKDFSVNIDFDKFSSDNNETSIFFNHKIKDWYGNTIGIIGVYYHIQKFLSTIRNIEKKSNCKIQFIDEIGNVKLSSDYDKPKIMNINLDDNNQFKEYFRKLKLDYEKTNIDEIQYKDDKSNGYVRIKYLPQINLFLAIKYDMEKFYNNFGRNMLLSAIIILTILILILFFISKILRVAENSVKQAAEERLKYFQDSTRYLFSNIYEIDVTNDCFAKESIKHQFDTLKNEKEKSYSESLKLLAHRAIKKEFQDEFLNKLSCNSITTEFNSGNNHINLDCPVLIKNEYLWIRFDVYIFMIDNGKKIHAYIYAKDINNEVKIQNEARTDALTQCLTRGATEQSINEVLLSNSNNTFAFFILDIDNFKNANDTYGHDFGDYCIQQFSECISNEFRKDDIIGRFGGDEFVVFVKFPSKNWVLKKAQTLVNSLNMTCEKEEAKHHISSSIGISLFPQDGEDLLSLYKAADAALYVVKKTGKNNFMLYENAQYAELILQ